MVRFRNKIAVLSGKGGAGKTTVACNIALKLSQKYNVALLDGDITTPNVSKYLGIEDRIKVDIYGDWSQHPHQYNENLEVFSIGSALPSDIPIHWQGEKVQRYIIQCFASVKWKDNTDYLIVDYPPTTSDEFIAFENIFGRQMQAILVAISEDMAILDAERTLRMCERVGMKVLGIVENYHTAESDCCEEAVVCSKCRKPWYPYSFDKVMKIAEEHNIPYLGGIPFNPAINRASSGKEFIYDKYSVFDNTIEVIEANRKKTFTELILRRS